MVSAAPTKASLRLKMLSCSASSSATTANATISASASYGETTRAASGRARVRRTCGSMLRSARSLMMQPALRITTVPATKMTSRRRGGCPALATHRAHSAGQSSSQIPIGRSRRMSCTKACTRRTSHGVRRCGSALPSCRSADASILLPLTDPAQPQGGHALGRGLEHLYCGRAYLGQQIGIAGEIRDAQLCQSGLATTEQLTRTAQLEVAICDPEAVAGVADRRESRAGHLRQRRPIQQHAVALVL